MAQLQMKQRDRLEQLGRPPIPRRAEINFSGNEVLQRAHCDNDECPPGQCHCGKGMHHLPEYQKTGTYMHPALVQERMRVAADRVERWKQMKMSETERKRYAPNGLDTLQAAFEKAKEEYVSVIGAQMQKELTMYDNANTRTMQRFSTENIAPHPVKQANIPVSPQPEEKGPEPEPALPGADEEKYVDPSVPEVAPPTESAPKPKNKGGRPKKQKLEADTSDDGDLISRAAAAATGRPTEDLSSL